MAPIPRFVPHALLTSASVWHWYSRVQVGPRAIHPRRSQILPSTGFSFAHAEQALRDPLAVTIEDPDAEGERRFVTLGMDALGRILIMVHTPRGNRTRLISARKASRSESEQYHA